MKNLYIVEKSGEIIMNLILYGMIAILVKLFLSFITGDEIDNLIYFSSIFTVLLIQEIRKYRVWLSRNKNNHVNPND